jgi:hypothetical protein
MDKVEINDGLRWEALPADAERQSTELVRSALVRLAAESGLGQAALPTAQEQVIAF